MENYQNKVKPIRYALYVRKSSEDEQAQSQSLPDQIRDCKAFAEREGLLVIKTVSESKSAKASNNRPEFTKLLQDLSKGKYDGILSWHPDRLARNSLESGMIVDMLDTGIIKDLKFPTCQFTNDASGKLLLNILFAMSKQYSEHLSESVQRGVDSNLEQGKSSGVNKWGYIRDDKSGYYEPSDDFETIKNGWQMRIEGKTLDEIVEYWKTHKVHRITKITRKNKRQRIITISSKQMASTIFKDPFYYGILCQAGQEVDLRTVCDFKPMVDEATYNAIQAMGQRRSRSLSSKKRATFYPLRGMVNCGVCGSHMAVGKSKSSSNKYYLYYRCDNRLCDRQTKNVRAKNIFDDLYVTLDGLKFTEKEYKIYSQQIDTYTNVKLEELRAEKRSLTGARSHKLRLLKDKSRQFAGLPSNTPKTVSDTIISDLEDLDNEVIDMGVKIDELATKLVDPEKIKLTKEEFLNLANSVADKMKAGTSVEKDILCRTLFLNLTLDNKNAPSYLWKEPFGSLLKAKKINFGARERT